MYKSFYKPTRPLKVFFDANVAIRSTAYGKEVAERFRAWRTYFSAGWNARGSNFLICAQGDVAGNAVRTDGVNLGVKRAADTAKRIVSSSVLPPLWFGKGLYEVGRDGVLRINGNAAGNLGSELKAWAILTLPEEDGGDGLLFVVGKPVGAQKPSLTAYRIAEGGAAAAGGIPLEATLDASSYLACFGRHVFLVHNARLEYFYYAPETSRLERVPLGGSDEEDPAWCRLVRPPLVADESGVYWVAGNDIYGFRIGYPSRLLRLEGEAGNPFEAVSCVSNVLLAYCRNRGGRRTCLMCAAREDGSFEKRLFNVDAEANLVLAGGKGLQYVKLTRGTGRTTASLMTRASAGEQLVSSLDLNFARAAFCCFGTLYPDVRYAGFDETRTMIAIQI